MTVLTAMAPPSTKVLAVDTACWVFMQTMTQELTKIYTSEGL